MLRFWATVCKTVCPIYQTVICPVCQSALFRLSVTLVHCGQMVGRIKMKLGVQVGLCPGHIVLVGDPVPLPRKGVAPPIFGLVAPRLKWAQPPVFGPCKLWHIT